MLVIASLSLTVACSNDDSEDVETTKTVEEDTQDVDDKKEIESENTNEDYYFDGEVAEMEDVKIKIIETKVIQSGEEGNETGENPVFAIW